MRDTGLRGRYLTALRSTDAAERVVSAELLRRLDRATATQVERAVERDGRRPALWGDVGAADLLAQLGASRVEDRGTRVQSSHDWAHGSRSGACLVFWPSEARWWCSSCRRSGDLVTLVRDALGIGYDAAVAWLAARYGPPAAGLPRRRRPRRYNPAVRSTALIGADHE
jgi:hypothetical protein